MKQQSKVQKVRYDPVANAMNIQILPGFTHDSDEVLPGVIFDYNKNDELLSIEILDAKTSNKHVVNYLLFNSPVFQSWASFSPSILLKNLTQDLSHQNGLQTS